MQASQGRDPGPCHPARRSIRPGGKSSRASAFPLAKRARSAICWAMITVLTILTVVAMLATLGTLFAGMVGMVRGTSTPMRSNALMRWRVTLQGVALGLFVLLLLASRH